MGRRLCVLVLILAGMVPTATTGAEPRMPTPGLSPAEVVEIQLTALQHNDTPIPDAGIMQTWAFAHPDNRRITGPLPRFAAMLKGPGYAILINHRRHEIKALAATDMDAVFAITVTGNDGRAVLYQWQVSKAASGEYAGMWMTTAVSPPIPTGEET